MNKNVFDILKQVTKVKVIQGPKDPDLMAEYFIVLRKELGKISEQKALESENLLYDDKTDTQYKQLLLLKLATIDDIEAYKILEKFLSSQECQNSERLKMWTELALTESKALLESSLLGEKYLLISNMLGGEEDKLRYFVILLSAENKHFGQSQKEFIEHETRFILEQNNSILEKIEFGDYFANLVVLIPFTKPAVEVIEKVVKSVNELGNILDEYFIVKNYVIWTVEETQKWLEEESLNTDRPAKASEPNANAAMAIIQGADLSIYGDTEMDDIEMEIEQDAEDFLSDLNLDDLLRDDDEEEDENDKDEDQDSPEQDK